MAENLTDVLVAGYQSVDAATTDFDALIALVDDGKVEIEGVILVTHAADGSVVGPADRRSSRPQGRRLGRRRRARGRSVRAAAARVGRGRRRCRVVWSASSSTTGSSSEIHDKIGENLPPGSAGIIAVFADEQRLAVEQALAGRAAQVGRADRQVRHRRAASRRSRRRWASSAPTAPCSRSRTARFGGTIGRTMDKSVADWSIVAGRKGARRRAERADLPHRRRRVRAARHVRRRGAHAEPDACRSRRA